MFWGKKRDQKRLRLFFATDVHGSQLTFTKFVNAAKFYKVDVLVLGGDVTGKAYVPIVALGGDRYRATLQSTTQQLRSADELKEFETRLAKLGFYSSVVSEREYQDLLESPDAVDRLYHELAAQRLAGWIRLAEERLAGTSVKCYITGGNDDTPEIVDVLEREAREQVVACDGKLVPIGDGSYSMVGLGYSNPTPWQTPREVPEADLGQRLEAALSGLQDYTRVIFNVHVPPVDSTLDTCPKLDPSTDPPSVVISGGQPVMFGAGSTAVRSAIERCQPLLSLHGHIHESRGNTRIGRTIALNPGSEYGEGVLRGAIVNIVGDHVESVQLTSG